MSQNAPKLSSQDAVNFRVSEVSIQHRWQNKRDKEDLERQLHRRIEFENLPPQEEFKELCMDGTLNKVVDAHLEGKNLKLRTLMCAEMDA